MSQLTSVKQIQSFWGGSQLLLKVHSKYDRHCKTYKLIKKNAIWEWKNECDNLFQVLKQRLSESPVLSMYDPNIPLNMALGQCYHINTQTELKN